MEIIEQSSVLLNALEHASNLKSFPRHFRLSFAIERYFWLISIGTFHMSTDEIIDERQHYFDAVYVESKYPTLHLNYRMTIITMIFIHLLTAPLSPWQ